MKEWYRKFKHWFRCEWVAEDNDMPFCVVRLRCVKCGKRDYRLTDVDVVVKGGEIFYGNGMLKGKPFMGLAF